MFAATSTTPPLVTLTMVSPLEQLLKISPRTGYAPSVV